jgi:hypothetical protein
VLVPTTKNLTGIMTVIRYGKIKAAGENKEIEHDFRPNVLT